MESESPYEDILGMDIHSFKNVIVPQRKMASDALCEDFKEIDGRVSIMPAGKLIIYMNNNKLNIRHSIQKNSREAPCESLVKAGKICKSLYYIITREDKLITFNLKDFQLKLTQIACSSVASNGHIVYSINGNNLTSLKFQDADVVADINIEFDDKIKFVHCLEDKLLVIRENGVTSLDKVRFKHTFHASVTSYFAVYSRNKEYYIAHYDNHVLCIYSLAADIVLLQTIQIKSILVIRPKDIQSVPLFRSYAMFYHY